jgi:hypothetical protein
MLGPPVGKLTGPRNHFDRQRPFHQAIENGSPGWVGNGLNSDRSCGLEGLLAWRLCLLLSGPVQGYPNEMIVCRDGIDGMPIRWSDH